MIACLASQPSFPAYTDGGNECWLVSWRTSNMSEAPCQPCKSFYFFTSIAFGHPHFLGKSQKYRELTICVCMFIIGLTSSVIPAIVFFGINGLLSEAFKAMFVLGVKYTEEKTLLQHIIETCSSYRLMLLIIIPCLIPFVLRWRSWRERVFFNRYVIYVSCYRIWE